MTLSKKIQSDINLLKENFTDSNKNETLSKIKDIVLNDSPKNRTISTRYSIIKKQFKEITDDQDYLKLIRPEDSITKSLIELNAKIRDEQKQIIISEETINKLKGLENTDDVFELAIYLLFITGRRVSEILSSSFSNIKKSKNIKIDGVKKRTDDGNDCEFPPLVSKTKFFKLYKKFMKILKFNNKNTFHRTLNRKLKKILGKTYKPHHLRGIYVTYLFKFRNTENMKINTFIKENLCHQSTNSSLSYTGYRMDFNKDILK